MERKSNSNSVKIGMDRRKFLTVSGMAGAFYALSPIDPLATSQNDEKKIFRELLLKLRESLDELLERSTVIFGRNLYLHSPSVTATYRGIWPDDFLYPMLLEHGLYDREKLTDIARFLTHSIVDLECFPDRVEADGMPIMQPGTLQKPHAWHMPLHLPAAWIRLIDNLEKWGATIPRKEAWAKIFQRSMEKVPFSCGLAYVDPQHPGVDFGFHDTEAITGFVLMSSMVLHFGLRRAIRLFDGYIEESVISNWNRLAQGIPDNLYRLFDGEQGAFFAGSRDCRQINVWGNGLAYWMVTSDVQKSISEYFRRNRQKIFREGFTRQIAEPGGWQRHLVDSKLGTYVNGGFWSVGTGWVLPAIAHRDIEFAAEIAQAMVNSLIKNDFREWITADGAGGGASGFLASVTVPMMGLQAIVEDRPFSDFF